MRYRCDKQCQAYYDDVGEPSRCQFRRESGDVCIFPAVYQFHRARLFNEPTGKCRECGHECGREK